MFIIYFFTQQMLDLLFLIDFPPHLYPFAVSVALNGSRGGSTQHQDITIQTINNSNLPEVLPDPHIFW